MLEKVEDGAKIENVFGGFVTLHIDCSGSEYKMALSKSKQVYLDVYMDNEKIAAYFGDETALPIAEFMQLDYAVRTNTEAGYTMRVEMPNGGENIIRKDSSLFLNDVLSYYIETKGEDGDLGEFDVTLTFGGNTYYLNTASGQIYQNVGTDVATAVLDEADLMQVMRKLIPYLNNTDNK
jgi:hypothetical protein